MILELAQLFQCIWKWEVPGMLGRKIDFYLTKRLFETNTNQSPWCHFFLQPTPGASLCGTLVSHKAYATTGWGASGKMWIERLLGPLRADRRLIGGSLPTSGIIVVFSSVSKKIGFTRSLERLCQLPSPNDYTRLDNKHSLAFLKIEKKSCRRRFETRTERAGKVHHEIFYRSDSTSRTLWRILQWCSPRNSCNIGRDEWFQFGQTSRRDHP